MAARLYTAWLLSRSYSYRVVGLKRSLPTYHSGMPILWCRKFRQKQARRGRSALQTRLIPYLTYERVQYSPLSLKELMHSTCFLLNEGSSERAKPSQGLLFFFLTLFFHQKICSRRTSPLKLLRFGGLIDQIPENHNLSQKQLLRRQIGVRFVWHLCLLPSKQYGSLSARTAHTPRSSRHLLHHSVSCSQRRKARPTSKLAFNNVNNTTKKVNNGCPLI